MPGLSAGSVPVVSSVYGGLGCGAPLTETLGTWLKSPASTHGVPLANSSIACAAHARGKGKSKGRQRQMRGHVIWRDQVIRDLAYDLVWPGMIWHDLGMIWV